MMDISVLAIWLYFAAWMAAAVWFGGPVLDLCDVVALLFIGFVMACVVPFMGAFAFDVFTIACERIFG